MITRDDCALLKQMVTDSMRHRMRLAEMLAIYGAAVSQAFAPDLALLEVLDKLEHGEFIIVRADEHALLQRTAIAVPTAPTAVRQFRDTRKGERPKIPSGGRGYSKYDHPYGTKDIRDKGHGVLRKFKTKRGGYRWYRDTGSRDDRKESVGNIREAEEKWPKAVTPNPTGGATHRKREEASPSTEQTTTEE